MAGISQVEAARKYGVSQSQISRWVKQGLIRVLRPGRRGRPYELAAAERPGGSRVANRSISARTILDVEARTWKEP
jgi:transposase